MTSVSKRHPATRWMGLTLAAGGALLIVVNAGIAPFMDFRGAIELTAGTTLFMWRQTLSLVAALCLLIGSVGVFLWQVERAPRTATATFLAAFTGTALLLSWEWINVFVIRSLALRAPDTLRMLEVDQSTSLWDLGAMIPLLLFTFGWAALAGCIFWTTPRLRTAADLVIGGLFATPILAPLLTVRWSGAVGSLILGAGWIWLGWDMFTASAAEGNTAERKALRVRR